MLVPLVQTVTASPQTESLFVLCTHPHLVPGPSHCVVSLLRSRFSCSCFTITLLYRSDANWSQMVGVYQAPPWLGGQATFHVGEVRGSVSRLWPWHIIHCSCISLPGLSAGTVMFVPLHSRAHSLQPVFPASNPLSHPKSPPLFPHSNCIAFTNTGLCCCALSGHNEKPKMVTDRHWSDVDGVRSRAET